MQLLAAARHGVLLTAAPLLLSAPQTFGTNSQVSTNSTLSPRLQNSVERMKMNLPKSSRGPRL